jgi:hypothetical protein
MIRDCSVPPPALAVSIAIALVVSVMAVAMPPPTATIHVASMPEPAAQSAEGNVVDLTY